METHERFLEVGRQYAEENESDFREMLLTDDPVPNYDWIGQPRPPLALRELVARRFQQVKVIAMEMQDWKEEIRLHALKLLSLIVIYSERNFFKYLEDIFPALIKCCQDSDRKVVAEAKRVAKMIGTFVEFDFWFERKLKLLKDMKTNVAVGMMRCFAAMFSGAQLENKMHAIEKVSCVLSSWKEVHSLDAEFLAASLEFLEQLIELYFHKIEIGFPVEDLEQPKVVEVKQKEQVREESDDEKKDKKKKKELEPAKFFKVLEERFLLQALIKNIAFAEGINEQALRDETVSVLRRFATSDENLAAMYEMHVGDFIRQIEDLDLMHSERADCILLLSGCITLCGIRRGYIDDMRKAVIEVLENSEPNAKIRMLSSVSIVSHL